MIVYKYTLYNCMFCTYLSVCIFPYISQFTYVSKSIYLQNFIFHFKKNTSMDSIFTLNEQILRNFGGTQSNSLTHIVQEEHSDIDDSFRFVQSNYYTHDDFVTTAANFMEHFSVLTLNCQSLHAKSVLKW